MSKVLAWGIIGLNGRLCEMTLREHEANKWKEQGRDVVDLSVFAPLPNEAILSTLAVEFATTIHSYVVLKEFLWHINNGEPLSEADWPDWHAFLERKKDGQAKA